MDQSTVSESSGTMIQTEGYTLRRIERILYVILGTMQLRSSLIKRRETKIETDREMWNEMNNVQNSSQYMASRTHRVSKQTTWRDKGRTSMYDFEHHPSCFSGPSTIIRSIDSISSGMQ